jgi:hypothetical protein
MHDRRRSLAVAMQSWFPISVALIVVIIAASSVAAAQNDSSVSLSSSQTPSTFGTPVTFTATVISGATGTITFHDGSSTLASATLVGSVATYSTSALQAGAHAIQASYSGDSNYNGSSSPVLTQQVNQADSGLAVTSAMNPSAFGGLVTITAATHDGADGTVTFSEGSTVLQTSSIPTTYFCGTPQHPQMCTSWSTSFSSTAFSPGTHTITVSYAGDNNYGPATSSITQTITGLATTPDINLTSSPDPSILGDHVVFSATASGGATGRVTFTDDVDGVLDSAPLNSGTASVEADFLDLGTHFVTASYEGDGNHTPATSWPREQDVVTTPVLSVSPNPVIAGGQVTLTAKMPAVATGTMTFMDGGGRLDPALLPL